MKAVLYIQSLKHSHLVPSVHCMPQFSPIVLHSARLFFLFGFILLCLNHAFACLSQISPCLLNKLELNSGEQLKALNQLERVLLFKNLKVSLSLPPSISPSFLSFCKHHLGYSYVVCSKSPRILLTQHGFWEECMQWLLCSVVDLPGAGPERRDPCSHWIIKCLGEWDLGHCCGVF